MPNFPITPTTTYDYATIVMLIIIGVGIALKAGQAWGWLIVGVAVVWAYFLTQQVYG